MKEENKININSSTPLINPYGENTQKTVDELRVKPNRIQVRNYIFNHNKKSTKLSQEVSTDDKLTSKEKEIRKRREKNKKTKKQKAKLKRTRK